MIIIPAIDLKDGQCVRLTQGRAGESKVYSEDPVEMARHWAREGAEFLHIVDLDGAFQGRPVHAAVIAEIADAIKIPVEVGGGLRTEKDIDALLRAGAKRAILGTRACENPEGLAKLAAQYGDRLAVGIDARNGLVQVKGWAEATGTKATDLARRVDAAGVKTIIYTDIARDGMMTGVNVVGVEAVCRIVSCDVIASGGITSVDDVRALRNLGMRNLAGAIVGKSLYEGRVSLKELMTSGQSSRKRSAAE